MLQLHLVFHYLAHCQLMEITCILKLLSVPLQNIFYLSGPRGRRKIPILFSNLLLQIPGLEKILSIIILQTSLTFDIFTQLLLLILFSTFFSKSHFQHPQFLHRFTSHCSAFTSTHDNTHFSISGCLYFA